LKNKTILITGGTGSLGKALVNRILKLKPKKVIVYSRGELAQVEMRREIPTKKLRFLVGDVRDYRRLRRALSGVDAVIHAAALKHVDTCEYNPVEAVQTNVIGAQNLIDAAIDMGVKKVVAISSDKSVAPVNLYGATKLCADKLFIAANAYSGKNWTKFSVVRFGNFENSNGSVIPYWEKLISEGKPIEITDPAMTRFHITLEDAAKFTIRALLDCQGGEVWSPKMDTYKVWDLALKYGGKANRDNFKIIGKRPGEKLHEDMVVSDDADMTYDLGDHYITYPDFSWMQVQIPSDAKRVPERFRYASNS